MRKMKHTLAIAAAVLLVFGSFVGCGSQGTTDESIPAQENTSGETFTVTLDPNGGAFADGTTGAVTISVVEGNAIDFASYMPESEGNTLYGWYQADGSPWPGARKVTQDVSLRAKWDVTEEVQTYALTLLIGGEPVTMEYENGVYQFTVVSSIYGGYAQRSGKYTLYEADLQAAIDADDGSMQRVLYKAESNYIDATGTLYGEFFNDGEFELYYDYTNAGERSKYMMDVGYWTYEGYEAPFENTPENPDETGMGAPSAHEGWNRSILGEETPDVPAEPATGNEDPTPAPGAVIFTVDADNSETMKANFCDNGVMSIYMTTYDADVDANYTWSIVDGGLVINYNGEEENIATDNGDGTYALADNYGNTYTIVLADLQAVASGPVELYTAEATNSETMFARFNDNGTIVIQYDLSAMGQAGQFADVSAGTWQLTDDGGLEITIDGEVMELTENNGHLEFTTGGNTYSVALDELIAAAG